jgi:three-Cys-motif partner protein
MTDLNPHDRLKEIVPTLTKHAEEIKQIQPDVVNDFGAWSALKLIVHATTVNMYTTVISSHRDDWFYVDALAGSGVSVHDGEGKCFHGSPVLAARDATEQFTKMYFIEQDDEKAQALRERLNAIFNGETHLDAEKPECGFEVVQGDANDELEYVRQDMWRVAERGGKDAYFNYLSFIDNQGLDVEWEGIEHITPTPHGDLLVNFPSKSITRPANSVDHEESMNDFYGSEIWTKDRSRDALLDAYCTRLTGVSRPTHVVTNVHSGKKDYHYDLIYATKEDAAYTEAIEYVRDFVEKVDGEDVEQVLDIVDGDQETLASLLPEQDNKSDEDEDDDNGTQTGLGDF